MSLPIQFSEDCHCNCPEPCVRGEDNQAYGCSRSAYKRVTITKNTMEDETLVDSPELEEEELDAEGDDEELA